MSGQSFFHRHSRPARARPLVLLADPNSTRRRKLAKAPSHLDLVEAASLNEVYPIAEEMAPDIIALSAEFLIEPEVEGVIRLAEMMKTTLFLYAEEDWIPVQTALSSRLRCLPMQDSDRLGDLLDRLTTPQTRSTDVGVGRSLPDLVLIGASTGGIAAIESVLLAFPSDCPPTLVVQHIRDGFVTGLVQRLNLRCRPRIVAATDDLPLRRGTIYFAADAERHLTFSGRTTPRCALVASPPCQGHRPAVDPLFESAVGLGSRVSAALLTGMGSDGAQGLGALKRAGAYTIAQDQATSIIWGMPGAAVEAGAATDVLPIDRIGPALLAGRRHATPASLQVRV